MKPRCTRCSAYKNEEGINCQPYFGNTDATYMFIGEMFGVQECIKGEPFVGDSGKILTSLLDLINLKKEDVAIDNAVKCYIAGNKTPTKQQLDACFIHLNRNIREVKPKLIIALGASALYSLTDIDKSEFKFYKNRVVYSTKVKAKVYVLNHPAAQLYNAELRDEIRSAFLKIPEMVDAEPFVTKNYPYTIITTDDDFDSMCLKLSNNLLGLDIETDGRDPYTNNIKTIQVGKRGDLYLIPVKMLERNSIKLKELLETNSILGQDYTFDAKWLYVKLGIELKYWEFDTCLAEFVLSGMKNNDLNYLTGKYNPDYYGYWKEVESVGGAHLVKNTKVLYQYGINDIGTLFAIKQKQERLLFKCGQDWLFKNILMPTNKLLTEMSLKGVRIDIPTLWKTDKKFANKSEKALMKVQALDSIKKCEMHFGKKFNPKSSQMVKWLLIDYYGLPILKKTKKGGVSVGIKEMEVYAKKHENEYCKSMVNYRSIESMRKNFLSGIVPKLVNNVAHTKYSLHATGSGRPNSTGINLLNIPRNKIIKRCYVPHEGFTFVYSDFSTMEIRVAAMLSGDYNLIKLCNDKTKEFHSAVACEINSLNYIEFENRRKIEGEYGEYNLLRTDAKGVSFGILYQMSKEALALQLRCSVQRAEEIIYNYFAKFPILQKYIEDIKEEVIKYGCVSNYFGFKRSWKYHKEEDAHTLREAVNHPIQSTAVFLTYLSMIKINKRLIENRMKSFLSLQVYDSIICQSPEDEIKDVAYIMQDTMENINKDFDKLDRVQLIADICIGNNLGDLKKIGSVL